MKKYSIEELKNIGWLNHYDGDIFIADTDAANGLPAIENNVFETDILVIIICVSGSAEVNVNERQFHVNAKQMLVCMPHVIYKDCKALTADFRAVILGLSTQNFNLSMFGNKNIWDTFYAIYANPMADLTDHDMQVLSLYSQIADIKVKDQSEPYHKEILTTLLHSVIFEMLCIFGRTETSGSTTAGLTQGDILFRHFIELLGKYDGKVRSVTALAEELCVSPKYLSTVVKASCGRTALELIHETAIRAIMRELKYTDKSIKEISNEMGFSSLSFFGKFVKSQLGVSPKKFRRES